MQRQLLAILIAVVALVFAATAAAQSPASIPVQGSLTDAAGAPVEGPLDVTFTLYSDPTGDAQLWSETQTVTFVAGTFAAYLGDTEAVDLRHFRDYTAIYLGVAVAGDAEMDLVRIATAPYAGYATYCGEASLLSGKSPEQLYTEFEGRIGDTTHARYTDDEARNAMGALGDTNALNHNRFTPSEAVAAMGASSATNTLNHARYTDAEAVTAMGTLGDNNPLHHARYTDTEAVSAMGAEANGNALRHARYSDTEAVAAVQSSDAYVSNAGDTVNGDLTVTGGLSGNNLSFRDCGTRYSCTPRQCLALCIANGERMAFVDEVYAWASSGRDSCAYKWMLDRLNMDAPVVGFPMFTNRTTSGCGRLNTTDIPRIEGFAVSTWDTTSTYDCACARIR